MATKANILSTFNNEVKEAILNSLMACMDAEDGNWSPYSDFIEHLAASIQNHTKNLVSNIEQLKPKVSNKSAKVKGSGSGSGGKRKNGYTTWVHIASEIRKGALSGNQDFTVTENFKNKSSPSAIKYDQYKEDLDLDGKIITIRALIDLIKKVIPGEKDLTLTAICWGLMPTDFRENLVNGLI